MKQLLSILILSVLSIVLSIVCKAQVVIKPGDKLIKAEWIKPGHNFYRNQIKDTTGKLIYDFVMEDFTFIDTVKKQIIFARSRQVPPGNFATDTSVTSLQFKPISMHEIQYQRQVSFDMHFYDDKAIIQTTKKGITTQHEYKMISGYFEDNMVEYIFGYLDLKKGVIYQLDNFNKDTQSPSDPYLVDYVFDDSSTSASDHTINYTVLHYVHGGTTGYMWIDKSTHLVNKMTGYFKTGSYLLTKI